MQTTRNGFEPSTSAVTGRRSNQLSHRAIKGIYIPSKPHIELPNTCNFFPQLSDSFIKPDGFIHVIGFAND